MPAIAAEVAQLGRIQSYNRTVELGIALDST